MIKGIFLVGLSGAILLALVVKNRPFIHDITTDIENPPRFQRVLELRKNARNSAEYGGAEIGAQQRQAYPDIKPVMLEVPANEAFTLCLKAAKDMSWKIVNADTAGGIIEATATTFLFRFKDDIVIRITAADKFSRVDIRSVSRVGIGDLGANAKRIRRFIKYLTRK